jgi:UDP-N-acetylglucosamine transferase subunit ALG13
VIFLTVGTQLAFDRLVLGVDSWLSTRPRIAAFAQIGPKAYKPRHMRWKEFLDVGEFEEIARNAQAIISHAGMGTVITALDLDKPILIMPRRAALREHRNDHQVATARWLSSRGDILVAMDEYELPARVDELLSGNCRPRGQVEVSRQLIEKIRTFICVCDGRSTD